MRHFPAQTSIRRQESVVKVFQQLVIFSVFLLLTGCALPTISGPGLPLLLGGLLLAILANCAPLVNENRLDEFFLRRLLLDAANSGSGSANECTATQNYTQSFDLSTVDLASTGTGYTITGDVPTDTFGISVAAGGDFNGDGIGDFLVADDRVSGFAGIVYVIFGVEGPRSDFLAKDVTSNGDGIQILGSAGGDFIGQRVQALDFAGDVNGDGFDDVIVGSIQALGGDGSAFLIYGSANPGDVTLTSFSATEAARFDASAAMYYAGYSVAGLGDINGDGFDDFAFGHKYGVDSGSGYYGGANIVFGTASTFASPVSTATITGSVGRTVTGATDGSYTGSSISPVGDLNQDGLPDLIIGTTMEDPQGGAYVVYGQSGTGGDVDLGALGGGGFKITGVAGDTDWGLVSSGGGDFNGDGIPDFVTATEKAAGNSGKTALLFGGVGVVDLGTLTTTQGFVLEGTAANDYSGKDAVLTDDINGDGLDDLLIGASGASNGAAFSGSAYLIFGRAETPTGTSLFGYSGGTIGIRIDGSVAGATLGSSVATGDVNGDGCADMIIGSAGAIKAHVIFGGKSE